MKAKYLLLLLLLLVGCRNPLSISAPYHRFTPPDSYRALWDETRACAHRWARTDVSFDEITWYVVEANDGFFINGQWAAGAEHNRSIYLSQRYAETPWVVKHEMMHAMTGVNEHQYDPFVRCGLMQGSADLIT